MSVQRVRHALEAAGLAAEIQEFDASTATAVEAAAAIGTNVDHIVKSLVFSADGAELILVLVSGPNRVDTQALSTLLGKRIKRADAERVRESTGFAIGGVPPLGLERPLPVYIDRDLLRLDRVWAAAGSPHAVFPITPPELVRVTTGTVVDLKQPA